MTLKTDVAVIGAGMAGASLAAEIAAQRSVLLIEAEEQPGYHATGRSAAFWSESYGGALIQPLTSASGPFLAKPPPAFSGEPFLRPRGAIHIADAAGEALLASLHQEFVSSGVELEPLDRSALRARIPSLRQGWDHGLHEPSCSDIAVAELHAAYLKQAKARGASLLAGHRVDRIQKDENRWLIKAGGQIIKARILVNATGAWADQIALAAGVQPVGIRPYRRTLAQLRIHPPAPADMPLVVDAAGRFYFKPEAGGRLWLSPHDETACNACDAAAEEYDVALAIDRLQRVVDWKVERVERSWAGLRSFAPDRLPVYGYAAGRRDFFWFAGQGGFGIQTAPAAAKLAASLLLEAEPDQMVKDIDPAPYLAERFAN